MIIGKRTDLRLQSKNIKIGENVQIDDNVRIVVPEYGKLTIGDNVKIGVGTIINCGGEIVIGEGTSFYGYCYVQASSWHIDEKHEKQYNYYTINIGQFNKLAPFTVISNNITTEPYFASKPNEVVGLWV